MVQVEMVRIPSETVAVVRREIPADRLPAFFEEAFDRVAGSLPDAGGHIAGPPFGWYHGLPTKTVDVAAGFPVAGDVHGPDGGVTLTERPGCRALVAVHVGSYDGLAKTWGEVEAWVEEYSLPLRGDSWEEYLTDPTGDPATWRTRVVLPLQS
jgi:effector-binding domain-containing protein